MSGIKFPAFDGQPESLHTRVSAAIRPYDPLVTGGALTGSVSVQLDGIDKPPIRNLSGWFVFTGLTCGREYTLRIESEHYMPVKLDLQAPASADALPVKVDAPLLPKASYPFPGHLTLIRALVEQPTKRPADHALVEAHLFEPEDSYIATLAENAEPGSSSMKLAGPGLAALVSGSVLMLKDTIGKLEYVRLASPVPDDPTADGYPLAEALRYSHQAGTAVYALKETGTYTIHTDGRGEFAIPVTRLPLSRGFVALTVLQDGYKAIHRDIQCEEGRTASLGVLTLLSI
jgi:hypothetical protein